MLLFANQSNWLELLFKHPHPSVNVSICQFSVIITTDTVSIALRGKLCGQDLHNILH